MSNQLPRNSHFTPTSRMLDGNHSYTDYLDLDPAQTEAGHPKVCLCRFLSSYKSSGIRALLHTQCDIRVVGKTIVNMVYDLLQAINWLSHPSAAVC